MIIRSVEPRAPAHLYWLLQVALLMVLIVAMLIAAAALGSPHVIRSPVNIGRDGGISAVARENLHESSHAEKQAPASLKYLERLPL
jgi:hypothetical protein